MLIKFRRIRIVVDGIQNMCTGRPMEAPMGRRAYFGIQSKSILRRQTDGLENVLGLNVLPLGVNVTIFQQ